MKEIWKVAGITKTRIVEVSNLGNVRETYIKDYNSAKTGRHLKDDVVYNNYWKVGKENHYYLVCAAGYVHKLVAKAFIPNPNNKPEVDHIDTNPFNNNYLNLKWVTKSENMNNKLTLMHISNAVKGRKHSEHTKKLISLGNIGKTLSAATKEKMSIAAKNRK